MDVLHLQDKSSGHVLDMLKFVNIATGSMIEH